MSTWHWLRCLPLVLGLASVACGGKASLGEELDGGGGAAGAAGAPAIEDAGLDLGPNEWPSCGEPLLVSGGPVRVGRWWYDEASKKFDYATRCKISSPPSGTSKRMIVKSFDLSSVPATNRCYKQCVREGACSVPVDDVENPDPYAWSDEAASDLPVGVTQAQAAAFCKWQGGRLPTLPELLRAAQADDETAPGIASLTFATAACAEHDPSADPELCQQLARMRFGHYPYQSLYPVGLQRFDVGPFEHRDLFGLPSWTSSSFGTGATSELCKERDGQPAPGPDTSPNGTYFCLGLAEVAARLVEDPGIQHGPTMLGPHQTPKYWSGVRCAFDR
ncbi:MAG: SUMF1/EgtB/PvdO family nonheme iron enzyme [Polyangiaceae bacterium]|nr:SUMF1/EgtB/PvdO family nonheme iron enzyme [Polyangiaceae bacterium]